MKRLNRFSFSFHNSAIMAIGMVFAINVRVEVVLLLMPDGLCCPKTTVRSFKERCYPVCEK